MLSVLFILSGYSVLCGVCWHRYRQRQTADVPAADMLLAYASQTGRAQDLARQTAEQLQLASAIPLNQINGDHLRGVKRALFIVSTYGEGEPPDMGAGFVRKYLRQKSQNLAHLSYAVLALGDRQYPHFCRFGKTLYQSLRTQGAKPLFDLVEMDGQDSQALNQWRSGLAQFTTRSLAYKADELTMTLCERVHLNPGSPGAPVYRVSLTPDQSVSWQAGDILSLILNAVIAGDPVKRGTVADGETARTVERDYSIASIPKEGKLTLVVRQMRTPEGRLGLGSGWLTEHGELNTQVRCRLKRNPTFHSPPPEAPLILIGNGTGIAGLRAHIKARGGKSGGNWLLFGERTRECDSLLSEELEQWQRQGDLARIDWAFSQDRSDPCYVQTRLRENATRLKSWVEAGAYVFVCGSKNTMAADVEHALWELLGDALMVELIRSNRYRCDIY